MPIFLTPVSVESLTYKNRKEISDFGDLEENRHVLDFIDSLKINESGSDNDDEEEGATAAP
jgi:hypothetical protein